MALVFHDADDDHAPFPHRVLIIPESSVIVSIPGTKGKREIHKPKQEFIICSNCDHWIGRDVTLCQCEYRCHALGILLAEMTLHGVESKVKGQTDPEPREARS